MGCDHSHYRRSMSSSRANAWVAHGALALLPNVYYSSRNACAGSMPVTRRAGM